MSFYTYYEFTPFFPLYLHLFIRIPNLLLFLSLHTFTFLSIFCIYSSFYPCILIPFYTYSEFTLILTLIFLRFLYSTCIFPILLLSYLHITHFITHLILHFSSSNILCYIFHVLTLLIHF